MSIYAYQWAKRQQVGDSSTKTLLKTYAHWAAEDYTTWVTNQELIRDTELDIKTIRKCRDKLITLGYLAETPRRVGETRSIVVYQMLAPADSIVVQSIDQRTREQISLSPPSAEECANQIQKRSGSRSGASKGDPKRNASVTGAALDEDPSPSNLGLKSHQFSLNAPPDLAPNKAVERQKKDIEIEVSCESPTGLCTGPRSVNLPDWLAPEDWAMWCEHREATHSVAPWTSAAAVASICRLAELRGDGHDSKKCIQEAVLRGWKSFWPPKGDSSSRSADTSTFDDQASWWESASGVERKAVELGVPRKEGEPHWRFSVRVFKQAGEGPWRQRILADMLRTKNSAYASVHEFFYGHPPTPSSEWSDKLR